MGTFHLLHDTAYERLETEQDGERFVIRQISKVPGVMQCTSSVVIIDKSVAAEISAELAIWVSQ